MQKKNAKREVKKVITGVILGLTLTFIVGSTLYHLNMRMDIILILFAAIWVGISIVSYILLGER